MPPSPTAQTHGTAWPTSASTTVLVENLGIMGPRCSNVTCRAFREGLADDERRTPLLGLFEYAKWTIWFYSFWILVFTAIYVSHLLHDRLRRMKKMTGRLPSLKDKAVAFVRFWAYRRPNTRFTRRIGLRQLSYGTLALLAISTVFLTILPWPQKRYLQAHFRVGSPPLSTRCAMMISALTPLTVALAGKVNVITWITGIGYVKLNVYHRYVSYVIFCLATVHTIPHLVVPVRDGGWAMLNKLYANQQRELSGTPLYFTIFGLSFFSIPWIRRRFYEAFKFIHAILGVSYIALLCWHIWGEYMSPYCIYATIAILIFSNIIRIVHRQHNLRPYSNFDGFPTTLTHAHGNTTRIAIEVPKSLKWKPGQHAFLRMPSISIMENHPFYITNMPTSETNGDTHEMVFLIRRHNGFTQRLFESEQPLAGDANLMTPIYSVDVEEPPAIISTGKARTANLEKDKFVKKEKSTEHIEDIRTITVLKHEIASPMPPISFSSSSPSSFSLSLAISTQARPTLNRQSSTSSFPPSDEITAATLQAIAQKPAGIRTTLPSLPPILPFPSFQIMPPASFPTSTIANRPPSICSLPPVDNTTSATLLSIAQKRAPYRPLRTIVDGPYGTHHRPLHRIYDTFICIAGGSGIAACLSHILSLTQHLRNQNKDEIVATRRIHLIWIVRDAEWTSWIGRELSQAIRNIYEHPSPNNPTCTVDVFVTRSETLAESASLSQDELGRLRPIRSTDQKVSKSIFDPLGATEKDTAALPARPGPVLRRLDSERGLFDGKANYGIEMGEGSANHGASVVMHYCRPVIKDLVEGYMGGSRAIVMGCGPASMSAELANVTAALQSRVWNGEMREVKLEIETFEW